MCKGVWYKNNIKLPITVQKFFTSPLKFDHNVGNTIVHENTK